MISKELVTVIGSDSPRFAVEAGLIDLEDDIKQYLLDPDLPLIFKIKIGLRYYITAQPELILQLTFFQRLLGEN